MHEHDTSVICVLIVVSSYRLHWRDIRESKYFYFYRAIHDPPYAFIYMLYRCTRYFRFSSVVRNIDRGCSMQMHERTCNWSPAGFLFFFPGRYRFWHAVCLLSPLSSLCLLPWKCPRVVDTEERTIKRTADNSGWGFLPSPTNGVEANVNYRETFPGSLKRWFVSFILTKSMNFSRLSTRGWYKTCISSR